MTKQFINIEFTWRITKTKPARTGGPVRVALETVRRNARMESSRALKSLDTDPNVRILPSQSDDFQYYYYLDGLLTGSVLAVHLTSPKYLEFSPNRDLFCITLKVELDSELVGNYELDDLICDAITEDRYKFINNH